jgi:hypothetical protein
MMSHVSKGEILDTVPPRAYRATPPGKKLILDELVAITGYHSKYLIHCCDIPHMPVSGSSGAASEDERR